MNTPLPIFKTYAELRRLYKELSAEPRPLYKYPDASVRVAGGHVRRTRIRQTDERLGFQPRIYRDSSGRAHEHVFVEWTYGSLYTPQLSSGIGSLTTEWALCFKIDCDLARQKTGSIESAFAHYVSDAVAARDASVADAREALNAIAEARVGAGGRPRKTNADDLLDRYGRKTPDGSWDLTDETTRWILANADALNQDTSFSWEHYRSQIFAHRVDGVEEIAIFDDRIVLDFGPDHPKKGDRS